MGKSKWSVGVVVLAAVWAAALAASASATLAPNPYSFSSADRVAFVSSTGLGAGRCEITNMVGGLTESGGSIAGSITSGNLTNCSGPFRSGSILFPVSIAAVLGGDGVMTAIAGLALLLVNTMGGHCLYGGTLTGVSPGAGSAFTVASPRISLIIKLSSSVPIFGICENPLDITLTIWLANGVIG